MKKVLLNSILLLCALIVGSNNLWAADYVLVTNVSDLAAGDVILITNSKTVGSVYALGPQSGNNCPAKSIAIVEGDKITDKGDAQEITLETKNSDGKFTFKVAANSYLYAANSSTGSKNYLKTVNNNAIYWGITINTTTNVAAITDATSDCNGRNKMKYNANNGNPIFSCYNSAEDIYVFKKAALAPGTCATPTFSPSVDAVEQGQEITISCETAGASIYYTMGADPADPTASSTPYDPEDKPTVSAATTIKAIAIKDGMTNSAVGSKSYTIIKVANPTFITSSGSFLDEQEVEITCATGEASIYYTTDGSEPSSNSYLYSVPFNVTSTTTVKAIAIKAKCTNSDVKEVTYTKESLYSVAEVKNGTATGSGKYIIGYIVGEYPNSGTTITTSGFSTDANIALADAYPTTQKSSAIPVQLPTDALKAAWGNQTNNGTTMGYKVIVKGNITSYFSVTGVKNTSEVIAVEVPATISAAGWATFSSAYALDLTDANRPDGLTAYQVEESGVNSTAKTIAPTALNSTVAANTGLLLEGAEGTYSIPVVASGADISSTNKMEAVTSNGTSINDANLFVLAYMNDEVVFAHTGDHAATLNKGQAYLDLDGVVHAPGMRIVLGENNATNVESVEAAEEGVKFIQNGKLFIKKNGVVYDMLGTIVRK